MRKHVLAAVALCFGLLMLPFAADSAFAQKRVALVIGNGAYQNVAKLPNPIKDATAVADMFRKAGFDWVKMSQDVGNLDFKRALREFMDAATDADIAVVYYGGHGIQVRDMNYMIPVDARLATEIDAEDEAVSLDRIVAALEPAKRLRLVILDACRDNPFARTMKRRVATRALAGGLAKMEPMLGDTLIAYAAKAGLTADDGDGANSPFAAALVKHLAVPGLDIRLAFGRVRDEVLKATGYKQEPFVYGSLGGESIAIVPAPVTPQAPAVSEVRGDYQLVERIGTKKAWEVFLNTHKQGIYADLARAQLQKLIQAEQTAVATPALAPSAEPKITLAAVEPTQPPKPPEPTGEERRAWTRVNKDDPDKLRDFIARYPASPLAEQAKNRVDILDRAAQERAEKARAEREAKATEAERVKAEREAARQREAEQRQAALRREAEERQAKAASEAERLKAEREAKAAEAARKAAEAERIKAEREAAKQREAEARQAALRREAEERQTKAAAEAERQAKVEAERQAKVEAERQAKVEAERQAKAAERQAKAAERDSKPVDPACVRDEERLARLQASISQGWARADLKQLQSDTICAHVRSQAVALLSPSAPESKQPRTLPPQAPAAPPEPAANTPELIRSAQSELRRLGCFSGGNDGKLTGATKEAIGRYLTEKGRPAADANVTETFVASLKEQQGRVCPLTCTRGQHPEGDRCVADAKPEVTPEKEKPKATVRQRDEDDEPRRKAKPRREEPKREAARPKREEPKREAARPKPQPQKAAERPQPAARSQATSAPRVGGMIGVGF